MFFCLIILNLIHFKCEQNISDHDKSIDLQMDKNKNKICET